MNERGRGLPNDFFRQISDFVADRKAALATKPGTHVWYEPMLALDDGAGRVVSGDVWSGTLRVLDDGNRLPHHIKGHRLHFTPPGPR